WLAKKEQRRRFAGPKPGGTNRNWRQALALRFAVEEGVVEKAGEKAAKERSDPVNALIDPVIGSEGWAEGASRVESSAGERSSDHNAERNDQTNAEACERTRRVSLVDGGGEDREDEEKGCDRFQDEAGKNGEVTRECRGTEINGVPDFVREYCAKEVRGNDATDELSDPIRDGFHRCDSFGDPKADSDSRIEMTAGDVAECGNHECDSEAVCDGDREKTDTCPMQELIGANRACAKENQRECADKLSCELLSCGVHKGCLQESMCCDRDGF